MECAVQEREQDGKPARFWEASPDGKVQCHLCNHHCRIMQTQTGRCGVRRNRSGTLMAETYGMVSAEAVDPVEKKPLYHFLPGTLSYSLGSIGCNFSCSHCQNWHISQPEGRTVSLRRIPPETTVERAQDSGCASVSWTYNEPTLWYEYTSDMGRIARDSGLGTVYVTNGFMTLAALEDLAPALSAWRVDIKAFSDAFYRSVCQARLEPVLESTIRAHERGLHIEIVTLIIPGLNDSPDEIRALIDWVVENTGPQTPVHFTRFHPDFRMQNREITPLRRLEKIWEQARDQGLHYPYIGNVPEHPYGNTYCPSCGGVVISRSGYRIDMRHLSDDRCLHCGERIAIIRRV